MKILTILVGPPGSGKSTAIKNTNAEYMTISSDYVRIMTAGLVPTNSKPMISSKDDAVTWSIIMDMLETRMRNGSGIILDSTGLYNLSRIKKLKDKYGYRINYIHFNHLTKSELIRNIDYRDINDINESVLDDYIKRSEEFSPGSDVCYKLTEYSSRDALAKALEWYTIKHYHRDYNNYKEVFFIGDPHGEQVILDFLDFHNDCANKDNLYIFLGDLCDRGNKNLELLSKLMELSENDNVLFVEGNHDRYLNNWASDNGDKLSSDFITTTKKEFDEYFANRPVSELNEFKKSIRVFYKKMKPFLYFTFNDKKFFVNHGGIDNLYNDTPNMYFTGKRTYGYGSDLYASYIEVANTFAKNNPDVFQIFGHRNIKQNELEDQKCKINDTNYCVDCQLNYGNDAHILIYSKDGFSYETIENKKNISHIIKDIDVNNKNTSYLSIKKVENLYSVNFTQRAFYEKIWNAITVKARGLYLYSDNTVAGRSYDKFFNYNEVKETKLESLKHNLVFPVHVYKKYNGFLGIVFYDKERDILRMASKKTLSGKYPSYIKSVFTEDQIKMLTSYCKEWDVSFVFEIEHLDDPHIIDKKESRAIMLDIIKNDFKYITFPYEKMVNLFDINSSYEIKQRLHTFKTFQELSDFIYNVEDNINYDIEGFVITDSNNFSFKLKTIYYLVKKFIRTIKESGRIPKFHSESKIVKLEKILYEKYKDNLEYDKITHDEIKNIYNSL